MAVELLLALLAGCAAPVPYHGSIRAPVAAYYENPMFVPCADRERLWTTTVDVVDDYFKIQREEPVRVVGNVLTEGRLDTFPQVGSTVFDFWREDSVNTYEKLESTLQSIRRHAQLRVVPDQGGYWVSVAVFKELEEVSQPAHATAGAATFRNDSSLTRVVSPVGEQEASEGWIPLGHDAALEQQILARLQARLGRLRHDAPPRPGV